MAEQNQKGQVVVDQATSSFSDLWKKEDYWAIWLGFLLLLIGIVIYFNNPPADMHAKIDKANATLAEESARAPFKTVEWYQAVDAKKKLKATSSPIGKAIKSFTSKPKGWKGNPMGAFIQGEDVAAAKIAKGKEKYDAAKAKADEAMAAAVTAQEAAGTAQFADEALNATAVKQIDDWRAAHTSASKAKKKASVKPYNQIGSLIGLGIVMAVFFGIGMAVMGKPFAKFVVGFFFVFFVAVLAYVAAGNATMKHYGIGYAA